MPKATQHFQLFPIEKRTPSLVLERTAYKMVEALIPHPSLQRLVPNSKLPSKGAQLRGPRGNEGTGMGAGPGSGLMDHPAPSPPAPDVHPQKAKVSWNNEPIISKTYLCDKVSVRHLEESEMQTKEKKVKIPQHGTISKGFPQEETPIGTKHSSLQARDPKSLCHF